MESFDVFVSLKLDHLILAAAEQFFNNLQAKDIVIAEEIRGVCLLKSYFTSLQTDEFFSIFYQSFETIKCFDK